MGENKAYLSARLLVRELVAAGVRDFCVSPGYRNSSLLVALSKEKNIQLYSHIDERGAAFFALGLAKATGRTAALVCTSGTAAANYFPAILESYYGHVPLLVITADRPQELLGVGANQSMDQVKLFGSHVRFHAHVPAWEGENTIHEENARFLYAKSAHMCTSPIAGPVHLNIAFREPFLPSSQELEKSFSNLTPIHFLNSMNAPSSKETDMIAELMEGKKKILISLGQNFSQIAESTKKIKLPEAVSALSQRLNAPVFVENSSGVGFQKNFCFRFEHLLKKDGFLQQVKPDLIIRIGSALTSKAYLEFQKSSGAQQIFFDELSEARNQNYGNALYISGCPAAWIEHCLEKISPSKHVGSAEWCENIVEEDNSIERDIDQFLQQEDGFSEWHFHRAFSQAVGAGGTIFLGNSMPIRDYDAIASPNLKGLKFFSNRALSGIDGIISTAIGASCANTFPTHLLIGDISFLHDVNALSLAKRLESKINLNIFVINNYGGEIFRVVPSTNLQEAETLFTTPQQINFSAIAKAFGISYGKISSTQECKAALSSIKNDARGINIFEVIPDVIINTALRKKYWQTLKS